MSDIETAKPRDRLVDQGADVIVLADVGVDELGLRTERAQFFNERLAGLITPAGNDHLRGLPGDGGGATDAGQGSRDQYDWVILATCRPTGRAWNPTHGCGFLRPRPFSSTFAESHVGSSGAREKDFVSWRACPGDMEDAHGATAPSLFHRGCRGGQPDAGG